MSEVVASSSSRLSSIALIRTIAYGFQDCLDPKIMTIVVTLLIISMIGVSIPPRS